MKKLLCLLTALLLLWAGALAEEGSFLVTDEQDAQADQADFTPYVPSFKPLDWDVKISPNLPDPNAYQPDNMAYHDDSIDVRVETFREGSTLCYAMYVKLTDISQFRTGTGANRAPYSLAVMVATMAKKFHAVCAVNGDYFGYHSEGIVYRNGRQLRMRPTGRRDTLIVDMKGDMHVITRTSQEKWQAYLDGGGTVLHTFTFGPALVIDGDVNPDAGATSLDVGKNKHIQRTAVGQLDELYYVFVTCDGPENKEGSGLSVQEMAGVMQDLGCSVAYNLDGASSSTLVMNNVKINAKGSKKRPVGDCIWFATLVESK